MQLYISHLLIGFYSVLHLDTRIEVGNITEIFCKNVKTFKDYIYV